MGSQPVAGAARSWASSETNPGPNESGLDPSFLGATVPVAGVRVPVSDLVELGQAGAVRSQSTALSPDDTHAISGLVGSDGALTLDRAEGGFAPATIDLLSLFDHAGISGLTDLLVDRAELRFGLGGAEVATANGDFLDPDGVGGAGRYRLGEASLDVRSPLIEQGAGRLYDGLGRIDQAAEDAVNRYLDLSAVGADLPDGTTLRAHVTSQMQESVFAAILARPVTTKNKVLTVDFSTGEATIHLDQVLHNRNRPGDNLGLNAQHPNTELIDDELYPMIAESVHDLMEEVWTVAVGAIDRSVRSITVDFTATNADLTATWRVNLGGADLESVRCTPQGTPCDHLAAAVEAARPVVRRTVIAARDYLVGDAGHQLFKLAITDIKTSGITIPVRRAVAPFIDLLARVFSVQVNHQRVGRCRRPDGAGGINALHVSAVSVAVLRSAKVAVLNFGNAGTRTDACAPTARASVVGSSALLEDLAELGHSTATPGTDPGPNRSGVSGTVLGQGAIDLGGVQVPLDDFIDFGQAGALQSETTATSPHDARAITGAVGSDGAIHLDSTEGGFDPLSIDLLALFERAGIDTTTNRLVDEALLRLGIGGAEVRALDGTILDPDGVGGPGRYRVGQADMLLHSPAVEDAAAGIYSALDVLDATVERQVNRLLDLSELTAALPTGTSVTADVHSAMRDEIFGAVLARPITTRNRILTVDFATGAAVIHLDEVLHNRHRPGDPAGLNRQHPNTELVDDELYPMVAESVHDLMEEVSTIAIGAIERTLGSVTVDFVAQTSPAQATSARATWTVDLGGDIVRSPRCTSQGVAGLALCSALRTAVVALMPVVRAALVPARTFVIGDAGARVFRLAITDVKTNGITIPVRRALAPFIDVVARFFSVQLNRQQTGTCTAPDGSRRVGSLRLSAVSVAPVRGSDRARIDFGNAAVRTPCR